MENTWSSPNRPMMPRHRSPVPWLFARARTQIAPFDASLFFVTLFLTVAGICMLFSASYASGIARHQSAFYYVWKQMVYACLGLLALVYTSKVDLVRFRKNSGVWLLVTVFLLVLVWTPLGLELSGARRFLNTKPFPFQPSELAKLTLVVFLAHILSRSRWRDDWLGEPLVAAVLAITVIIGLILPQPHMSVSLLLLATAAVVCTLAGLPRKLFLIGGIAAVFLGIVGWSTAEDYQRGRVESWIRILFTGKVDPRNTDYQIMESIKGFRRGGGLGVGFCEGRQKLLFLPASHNDFIFSVIGEELGLAGTVFTIILYIIFIWRGFHIAYNASDQFCSLLAAGLTTMIALQAIIHIGVTTYALPTTGMSLPFISYGGSALTMTLAMVGFILNISRDPDLRTGDDCIENTHRRGRNRRARISGAGDRGSRASRYASASSRVRG